MLAHDDPFFIGEFAGLEQDVIRDAELADVVQQRAASHLDPLLIADPHLFRQPQAEFGHAAGVTFGLLVAQVHRTRPAFNGGIVGDRHFLIRSLHVLEHLGVIHGNGCLPAEGFEVF